jgi:hypothetical protein
MVMPKSITPLFDKLIGSIDFIWYRVVPLFKPDDYQADHERHMNAKDWFLYKFMVSSGEGEGLRPAYERTQFYKIAKLGEGLPNPDLLRRELLQAFLTCYNEAQMKLLQAEIRKTLFEIRSITNIVIYDLPQVKAKWVKQIQNAIKKTHDENSMKCFIERSGWSELDLIAYRDHYWPDAIKYLKCLYELVERIFVYVTDLREFSYLDIQTWQKSQVTSAPNSNDQIPNSPLAIIEKPKRINTDARDKHKRVTDKYGSYISKGYTHKSAVKSLVHDFRLEYNPRNASNRAKQINAIIRKWKE